MIMGGSAIIKCFPWTAWEEGKEGSVTWQKEEEGEAQNGRKRWNARQMWK